MMFGSMIKSVNVLLKLSRSLDLLASLLGWKFEGFVSKDSRWGHSLTQALLFPSAFDFVSVSCDRMKWVVCIFASLSFSRGCIYL